MFEINNIHQKRSLTSFWYLRSNFEHISHTFLVFELLIWTSKYWLGKQRRTHSFTLFCNEPLPQNNFWWICEKVFKNDLIWVSSSNLGIKSCRRSGNEQFSDHCQILLLKVRKSINFYSAWNHQRIIGFQITSRWMEVV